MTNSTVQMNDIRDIKPPIEISEGNQWIWWVLIFVALVIAAFLMWRWMRNRKTNIVLPPPVPAHLRAKRKLADALAFIAEPKKFCTLVSDTARFYLEERFQFRFGANVLVHRGIGVARSDAVYVDAVGR